MAKTKGSTSGPKTVEQASAERRRKRRLTMARKALALQRDCRSHVFLLVEEPDGRFFRYKTKKDTDWPPADAEIEELEDPILNQDVEKMEDQASKAKVGSQDSSKSTSNPDLTIKQPPAPSAFDTKFQLLQPPILEKSPVTISGCSFLK